MVKILDGIGAGLTILAAIRTALEVLDFAQSTRNRRPDYDKLKLRLNVEKCRLQTWTQAVGIDDVVSSGQDRPIDTLRFSDTIRDILIALLPLLDRAEMLKNRYASSKASTEDMQMKDLEQLSVLVQAKENVLWAVRDRRTFTALIAEIRQLLNRLEDITNPSNSRDAPLLAQAQGRVGRNNYEMLESFNDAPERNDSDTALQQQYAPISGFWNQPENDTWIPRFRTSRYRGFKL